MTPDTKRQVLVLGAGLTGLSAAEALWQRGVANTVLEAAAEPGGLARTFECQGFRFDLGGHRFVTDDPALRRYVSELLPGRLLEVPRSSKILMQGKWFDYPLKPVNALCGFGLRTSGAIVGDYLLQRLRNLVRRPRPVSLRDWVTASFGPRLFEIYFRDYSEKVWGVDCDQIDQSWVRERIQGLTLGRALVSALMPPLARRYRTLDERFLYPEHGIGAIADALSARIERHRPLRTSHRVARIRHRDGVIDAVEVLQRNRLRTYPVSELISTLPLQALVRMLNPSPPASVLAAAGRLRSRDLMVLTLMIDREQVTDQSWIYLPDRSLPFGRLHEPKNWSRSMAPPGQTALVLEYFCVRDDETWRRSDRILVREAVQALQGLGLIRVREVIGHRVLRIPNAYPLFDVGFKSRCQLITDYLDGFDNLHLAGRGGTFQYYNMDRAMLSGIDTAAEVAGRLRPPVAAQADDWQVALAGARS